MKDYYRPEQSCTKGASTPRDMSFTGSFPAWYRHGRPQSWTRIRFPILITAAAWIFAIFLFMTHHNHDMISVTKVAPEDLPSPFTGAFKRFPYVSSLPASKQRLTLLAVWNDDFVAPYLRHFYYTVQKNADSVDLLLVNRLKSPQSSCLDLAGAGIDATWAGNVKIICISDEEYHRTLVAYMCSTEYGWSCNEAEHAAVLEEFSKREDPKNYNWRPFLGYAFRSQFLRPENPFWAWTDQDNLIGNFQRYPFNVLSQVSFMTGREQMPEALYMAGQLTAFNFEDPIMGSAWKKFVGLRSVHDFITHPDGRFPDTPEEQLWSEGYLRSNDSDPGAGLSFVFYPDLHGDDFFDGWWGKTGMNSTQMYVLSGREILLASTSFTREEIEKIVLLERSTPPDNRGNLDWMGGEDGSAILLSHPDMDPLAAKQHAAEIFHQTSPSDLHQGLLQEDTILTQCRVRPKFVKQCIHPHPLSRSHPPIYRESVIRFREQKPMRIMRRLERDHRPRGYENKLIRHHLYTLSRGNTWFEMPPFEITDDLVLTSNFDSVAVWKMGSGRAETIFFRAEGEAKIG